MTTNNAVRSAVQRALCLGAIASAAGYMPAALGQGAEPEALEEITVTGTRIATQDYSAASPISTVDADLFSQTGAPTIETVLNTLPQFVPAITSTSNNPSNGGQANVALRGLDTTRTLVLLDGRRIVPSNDTGVVDLNLIPASIIQNVEIITGGASAVYGSDAVAGVVNIKTREFEGLEFTGGYGETSEGDGGRFNIGLTGGLVTDDGRGYAFGSFNYSDRDGVIQGDRDFSAVSLDYDGASGTFTPFGSSTIRQGRWDRTLSNLPTQAAVDAYFSAQDPGYVAGSAAPGDNYGFNPDGSLFDTDPLINFTGDTNEPLQPVADPYSYNFAPPNFLELPLERKSFFGKAGFEISDTLEVFTQVLWADYVVDQALAPTPATALYVRPDNPNLDADVLALLQSRPTPDQPFSFRKRMIESGPRISNNNYSVTQITAGMLGEIAFLEGWDWDLSVSVGNVNQTENQLGNVSRSAFYELSLADDHGASICGAALNPFGIGSISPECAAHYTKSATNETTVRQEIVDGYITGSLFEMPAGDVQVALGYLYKSDEYAFLPDARLTATVVDPVTGSTRTDITGFNAQDTVRGRTISREVYGEARVPLLGDAPAIEALDLIVGYRIADHNVAGNISSYKGEFIWDVTQELGFRGGYQRAVRAPNINELFRPATKNFPEVGLGDPCSNDFPNDPNVQGAPQSQAARDLCVAQGIPAASLPAFSYGNNQFEGLSGGNPNLQEETADTITFGVVWQGDGDGPLGNFSASVDYYQIEIEDAINSIDADVFVERCFDPSFNPNFSNDNQFCQLFRRDSGTGNIIDALEVDANLAVIEVRGIDFQVDYAADVGPGTFTGKVVATNLLDWEQAITTADPMEQFAGTASGGFDVLPEWKTTLSLGYAVGAFNGDVRMRYVGDANDTSFPDFKLDSVTYWDMTLGYDFDQWVEGLRARAGITNLSDEEPNIYPSNQQSNTDPATYDVLGRRYFVNLTYTF